MCGGGVLLVGEALIMRRTGMATCIGSGECIDPSIHPSTPLHPSLLLLQFTLSFFVNFFLFFFFLRALLVIVNLICEGNPERCTLYIAAST